MTLCSTFAHFRRDGGRSGRRLVHIWCAWARQTVRQRFRGGDGRNEESIEHALMSFFGLPQHDLEEERRKFLEGGAKEGDEDLQVFTWGEDSYDGLGDALHEGGDELNDETFGVGDVGEG